MQIRTQLRLRTRFSLLLAIAFLPILACLRLEGQGRPNEIDIGVIQRQAGLSPIAVHVLSSDPTTQAALRYAFNAHGGFSLVPAERAVFTFRFDPSGENAVRLVVQSGQPAVVLLDTVVPGADRLDASYRAADLAVSRTLPDGDGRDAGRGLPGIFAGHLAFVSDRTGSSELYTGDLFFVQVRRLTLDRAKCALPSFSPDGRHVVYTTYFRSGFPDLYRIELASGRRTLIAGYRGTNTGGVFNPRGDQLALILSAAGNTDLFLSDPSGRNLRRLTRTPALESSPSWSPDGSRLVFASDAPGKPQLYEMAVAGGEPRRLPTQISGYCAEPAWNPRHPHLIAHTVASGREFEIALFDRNAGRSRVITQGEGDAVEPAWTRDGRHLIYTQRTRTFRRLVLLDTLTGKSTVLRPDFGNSSMAAYAYATARP